MMPGMNPRQMKKMMKQMGIKQVDVPAKRVVISSEEKEIIISNPQVVKVNMMGQETFQITGDISEQETSIQIDEEDVITVMEKSGVDREKALESLEKNQGDLAKAILELSE